ncbi:NAD(P)/FAD-dependent oxidoreductase, partial [Crocinitomix sp.]|nr:NAD(P)/FAD-dependent oxidoreductase [Crocinitomix sp.]
DIEYQTYGWVFSELKEGKADFYWEHNNGEIAMHLVWDSNSKLFKGINVFGIRLRHELFDNWLRNSASIQEVLQGLAAANFDPEFYRRYEKEIITEFTDKTGIQIELKPKQWWRNLLSI